MNFKNSVRSPKDSISHNSFGYGSFSYCDVFGSYGLDSGRLRLSLKFKHKNKPSSSRRLWGLEDCHLLCFVKYFLI
ncbi:hypothetical protein ATANTOWER_019058 [Ataeniobius toweri]|uniref:Uncharacterized protein n=1 Tax=Ataeniobius toweri TaxID=208326 RepID=A0ABU7AIA1_9TELE|nr:hypothetical protein [Ataeniobius toweri]